MLTGLESRAFVLFALSLSQSAVCLLSSEQCGRRNVSDTVSDFVQSDIGRIQGGKEAVPHSWPWAAQLLIDGIHICDAVLIEPSFVLTTSHCVDRKFKSRQHVVRLGGHAYNSGFYFLVTNISIHPLFDKFWSRSYDYALLKISPPAKLDANVSSVCLPTSPPPDNGDCVVVGWGRTRVDGPLPAALQQLSVPIISPVICNDLFHYAGLIHMQTMMCAGYQTGGADACQGDSGGPLVCQALGSEQWQLQGLVSWGFGCGEPRFPGVYAKVFPVVEWIQTEMTRLNLA